MGLKIIIIVYPFTIVVEAGTAGVKLFPQILRTYPILNAPDTLIFCDCRGLP